MSELKGCKSYTQIMKEFENEKNPFEGIKKILEKNKV